MSTCTARAKTDQTASVSVLVSLLLIMLAAIMVGTAVAQAGPTVAFVTVAQGEASGVLEPTRLVIRDQATWQAFWDRHRGATRTALPAVDFGRDMLVAVFGGESHEMRRLTVRKVVRESDRLEVWYTLTATRPLPDGEGQPAMAPFHIVRLARSPLPVRFLQIKMPQAY
jgi:hypothetical protein